ncbi:hypothetical protein [Sphingobium sp. LMA1-1-1.1]|uniref:hypothetical protein n=1 Tax=Sphingobium sp. LMA1-1-1.1 TaxID=3135238 RepID=UPI00342E70BA
MSPEAPLAAMALILGSSAAGAWMLRRAWSRKGGKAPWRWAGLCMLLLAILLAASMLGKGRGIFTALTLMGVAGLSVVASGYTMKPAKAGRAAREGLAPEPAEQAPSAWRTTLRWSLAGPIGMVAAISLGISYAVWAPGEAQTRLLIGGLIVPLAWGGAMAWTLADSRILRATAVLVGTAIAGFGAAMLRGFA